MIYYTGDIHGDANRIAYFARRMELTEGDVIVILGDVGANYYLGRRDEIVKSASCTSPAFFISSCTFVCPVCAYTGRENIIEVPMANATAAFFHFCKFT